MLYLLLNVKLRNLLQSCHFLCWSRISAAALSAPVRTSSWCISEWVYCSSKLLWAKTLWGEKKNNTRLTKPSSHTSHVNSCFLKTKKLLSFRRKTPDCELQIFSQQSTLILPQTEAQAWERRTAEMWSLLFLLLCGSHGKTKPGQMICLCISQPKNSYSCKTKPLPTITQALQGTCQGM